jgi:calcium/calmodulin-dependent protein kinase I
MSDLIRGAFSEVFQGIHKATNGQVAIKVVKKKHIKKKFLEREIQIMTKLNHESILFCRDVFETPDIIYLVLELYVILSALSNDEAFLAENYMIKL